jgi:hypothetical protein
MRKHITHNQNKNQKESRRRKIQDHIEGQDGFSCYYQNKELN